MLAPELIKELKLIAFAGNNKAKPSNRVAALSSLARCHVDLDRVKNELYSISTDASTPDSVRIRAIDLLDKLDIQTKPVELDEADKESLARDLMKQYVRTA